MTRQGLSSCRLVLEDGSVWNGVAFGHQGTEGDRGLRLYNSRRCWGRGGAGRAMALPPCWRCPASTGRAAG